ncbi:hypothetical protein ACQPZX_29405 [Actinoplanes sp. CA-142083]|uniref:hypothetical protein n=1 Tax=Actinoplanes sp. CA-142083 TaxID=3239903 RepID=UPI003D8B7B31
MTVQPQRTPAAVAIGGGVWLAPALAEPVWRALRAEIERRRADGGMVRPEVAQALDALREAALRYLTDANGPISRTSADIDPSSAASASAVLPTSTLADHLGVSPRHVRRLAKVEGIAPLRRNQWAAEDAAALVARRRQ